jgi:glycerol-3-phosphate dehydrogenase
MNISIAISAARHGATIANHVRVTNLIKVRVLKRFFYAIIKLQIT